MSGLRGGGRVGAARARIAELPQPGYDPRAAGARGRGVGECRAVIGRVRGDLEGRGRWRGERGRRAGVERGVVAGPDRASGVIETSPVGVGGAEPARERDALDHHHLAHLHPHGVGDHEPVRVATAPAPQRRGEPSAAGIAADADTRERHAVKAVGAALAAQYQSRAYAARAAHPGEPPAARDRLSTALAADADRGDDASMHQERRGDPGVGDTGGPRWTGHGQGGGRGQHHGRAPEQTQGPVADRRGHAGASVVDAVTPVAGPVPAVDSLRVIEESSGPGVSRSAQG